MSEPWEDILPDDGEVEGDSALDSSVPDAPNTYGIIRRLASSDRITPVFMSHSVDDNVVSFEQGLQACQVINRIGLDINFERYPQGTTHPPHWFNHPLGIDQIGQWVRLHCRRYTSNTEDQDNNHDGTGHTNSNGPATGN
ncbi:Carboxylesterase SOBER1 [Cytospora mali]|uniref:Carboxylesterase SOBER1 n=1 Tax=Cytospora mali TaxID=578113 RepID=A0A194W004_CYTMA|nr:Carboxylesterase SOBER1 [Valsa mali]